MISEIARGLAGPRAQGRRLGALFPIVVGCAFMLLATGCGSSSSSAAGASGSLSAYRTCLRQHGVSLPAARPTSRPGGFGAGGFGRSGGGFGGGAFAKAAQACASLRPSGFGGPGGGPAGGPPGGGFFTAFQAFRSCMATHGETIPSTRPTAPPTGGATGADRLLNGLNPNNPKVASALKACQSKLPSFLR